MEKAQEPVQQKIPRIGLKSFIINGEEAGDKEVSSFLSTIDSQDRRLHSINYTNLNENDVMAIVTYFDLEEPSAIKVVKFGKK